MFHRPLATVLSSVSIRSLLPTRLFCAPATTIDDVITTVRTTGIRSIRDGSNYSEYGVYWGKDDPRNMYIERKYGRIDFNGTDLRPIMMALEQAKRDGLTRVRVQTDSEMNEASIRNEAQTFKNIDILSMRDQEFPKYVYCEKIAKIMDEMEVILEHRPSVLETENEVITLLSEDTNMHNSDSPDCGSIWKASPLDETSLEERTVPAEFLEGSTVQTVAIQSSKNSYILTTNGIYWGKGHPWNTKVCNVGSDTAEGARMQSIVMALEQAKNNGVKRIRVQTDLEMNEFSIRRAAELFKNIDLTLIKEQDLIKFVYCRRIVQIMDEIEVFLEYRLPWVNKRNMVIIQLSEDLHNQKRSLLSILSPEYEFDWTITPKGASPLEGRIVPTVYTSGVVHIGNKIGVSASLWVPESIEHLDTKQRPTGSVQRLSMKLITHFRAHLKTIYNVIVEAQKLELNEIQVVTHSLDFVHFFKSEWKKPNGSVLPNKKLYLDIKTLTETIKVHFKAVKLSKDCEYPLMKQAYEMANEGLSTLNTSADSGSSEISLNRNDSTPESVTESIVRTTGFRSIRDGNRHTVFGIYWGEGDPRNLWKTSNLDLADTLTLQLRSTLIALEQAKIDRLLRVHVQTDLKWDESDIRIAAQEYKDLDTDQKKNVQFFCERIANIMDEIEVILEHRKQWDSDGNEVITLLEMDRRKQIPNWHGNFSPDAKSDWTITPKDASPLEGRIVPTVYVSGRLDNDYKDGVTSHLWVPKSIEHLRINMRPCGSVGRLSNNGDPVSRFQAQLIAIRNALLEARSCDLPEILVITDSILFINFFEKGWKRPDGSTMKNEKLYLEIKALTETIKVHFKGVRHSEDK